MNNSELARYIDHTLLKANATKEAILATCEEAKAYHTASVCVNGCWAKTVHEALAGTGIKTCCVVGFPLGAMSTAAKAFETAEAVKDGAEEIDMVINIGYLKGGMTQEAQDDIAAVVKAAHAGGAIVKVIIETCLLTEEEKVLACELSKAAGADFVKTSTGFSTAGATTQDIALMRKTVGPDFGVKASSGIKTLKGALSLVNAGTNRLGTSSGIALLEDFRASFGK